MKLIYALSLLAISSAFIINSCKDNAANPVDQAQISLSLEDVSCTEVWIKLNTVNLALPADVDLYTDSSLTETINLLTADTLLYVDSLLPNQTYNFHTTIHSYNHTITSDPLTVTTMDTTSHNFTWQTWTFGGQAGSCTLYDVAIINENDIWAVGEIYLLDSLGQPDPLLYNAVHWNGNDWTTKRIQTNFRGNLVTVPLTGIFAFSASDIWMVGLLPIHGNGQNWMMYDLRTTVDPNLSLAKAWGKITKDMYFIGNSGHIVHYQNGQWSKIESGTDTRINDIWGLTDSQNNSMLYCPVSSFFVQGDKKILKVLENGVDSVKWDKNIRLYSAWTTDNNFLYVCGEGVFRNEFGSWREINLPEVGTNSIRGNNINDFFIVGDFGFKTHFNGSTWKIFHSNINMGYSHVSIKRDVVAICGNFNGKAIIEIGKRN